MSSRDPEGASESRVERELASLSEDRRREIGPLRERFRWLALFAVRDGILTVHAREIRSGAQYLIRLAAATRDVDSHAHDMLAEELALADRVDHPNIAPMEDAGVPGAGAHRLIGLGEARSLDGLLDGADLSPEASIAILRQIAEALDAAHRAGVLHGAFAPWSVVVDEKHRVKVVGVGRAEEKMDNGTRSGVPAYRAPEQWSGHPVVASTDQYAVAVLACEMLSGRRRQAGESNTLFEEIAPVDVPVRQGWTAGTVMRVTGVVRRALGRDPEKRHPTILDFVDSLERALTRAAGWETERAEAAPTNGRSGLAPALMVSAAILLIAAGLGSSEARSDARRTGVELWNTVKARVSGEKEHTPPDARAAAAERLPAVRDAAVPTARPAAPTTVAASAGAIERTPMDGFVRVLVEGGGGRVVAAGRDLGEAPGTISLPAGSHFIGVAAAGASVIPLERPVRVRGGDTVTVSFRIVRSR